MRADAAHCLPREFHTTGRICDISYTPDHQNLRGLAPILADISLTHPFVGNVVTGSRGAPTRGRICASEHR